MELERLKKFYQARDIINEHFKAVVEEMADEMIESQEQFQLGGYGNADAILDKYRNKLYNVEQVRCALLRAARQSREDIQLRNKDVHLKSHEFLCLVYRNIIGRNDEQCSECGWTWEI